MSFFLWCVFHIDYDYHLDLTVDISEKKLTLTKQQHALESQIGHFQNEMLLWIEKIRSSHSTYHFFNKWYQQLIPIKKTSLQKMRTEWVSYLCGSTSQAILVIAFFIFYYFNSNAVSLTVFLQLIICASQVIMIIDQIISDLNVIANVAPGLTQMSQLQQLIKSQRQLGNRKFIHYPKSYQIDFQKVSVKTSEEKYILNDISFTIPDGCFVAFMGTTGAGKTTIFKLLLGLLSPNSGSILLGAEDYKNYAPQSLMKNFGVVLQGSSLFPGSIFSNIALHTNISLDAAWELAYALGLGEEIAAMPMKMFTHISDNALESLSGGQRQKILIARALATKPKVIFLDEATSALDNHSQAIIFDYLNALNMTKVIIAHRKSTVVNADNIYLLEKGRIIDSGRYGELSVRHGF